MSDGAENIFFNDPSGANRRNSQTWQSGNSSENQGIQSTMNYSYLPSSNYGHPSSLNFSIPSSNNGIPSPSNYWMPPSSNSRHPSSRNFDSPSFLNSNSYQWHQSEPPLREHTAPTGQIDEGYGASGFLTEHTTYTRTMNSPPIVRIQPDHINVSAEPVHAPAANHPHSYYNVLSTQPSPWVPARHNISYSGTHAAQPVRSVPVQRSPLYSEHTSVPDLTHSDESDQED
ncbi:hypothetical protein BJ085DRAFT_33329 [Dimargaris cristalligena]|uniref:Uncharacterized protein n=1 Tax=Dimargaris cristalligena TaxID=215637 RepID=A0A4P9ZL87_9FUNG|nr:hypothetical protein BJ085DRAFT_33329 [Dimargaris cristalligena]|eukprot:RKP33893.1 hypothetical protein BJ085DRAFT_33329 [Dimargaris cristalligena]